MAKTRTIPKDYYEKSLKLYRDLLNTNIPIHSPNTDELYNLLGAAKKSSYVTDKDAFIFAAFASYFDLIVRPTIRINPCLSNGRQMSHAFGELMCIYYKKRKTTTISMAKLKAINPSNRLVEYADFYILVLNYYIICCDKMELLFEFPQYFDGRMLRT